MNKLLTIVILAGSLAGCSIRFGFGYDLKIESPPNQSCEYYKKGDDGPVVVNCKPNN